MAIRLVVANINGVSSIRRKYIPMGFLAPDVIVGDKIQFIPNATIYHFGILTSSLHMAWMGVVGGRLKSDYSYSPAPIAITAAAIIFCGSNIQIIHFSFALEYIEAKSITLNG